MDRRSFLRLVGAAAAGAVVTVPTASATSDFPLVLWATRAGEEFHLDYGTAEGQRALAWLLRDVRAGVVGVPDYDLVRLLCWMQAWLAAYQVHARFDFTSGLRTNITNDKTEGAARLSEHLPDTRNVFRASDLHTPSVSAEYLGRLAALAGQGGVGFYNDQGFIHVDRGRQRFWRGHRPWSRQWSNR